MKTTVKVAVSVIIVAVVLGATYLSYYLIGELWTMVIGVALMAVILFLFSNEQEDFGDDDTDGADMEDVIAFLQQEGETVQSPAWPDTLKPEKDQPSISLPSSNKRQLRNEEKWVRSRINAYIRNRDNAESDILTDSQKSLLFCQIGAMSMYYNALMTRCIENGAYLKKDDTDDSSSSSDGGSSSSDSSDSSSSDSSDSSSSSSDGGMWNGRK